MNFTKLIFSAAMAGALFMSPAAHAGKDKDTAVKLMNTWATEMSDIVDKQNGKSRRKALTDRTTQLSKELEPLTCEGNAESVFLYDWLRIARKQANLPVEVNYEPICYSGKLMGAVSLKEIKLDADDKAYEDATKSSDTIAKDLSDWGSELQKAIDTMRGAERRKKIDELQKTYEDKINALRCHPQVKFDFKAAVAKEKAKRSLPVRVDADGDCQGKPVDRKWRVSLETAVGVIPKERDSSAWDSASKDMFPGAETFKTDADKQKYADKFKPNGEYITKLVSWILCSEPDHTADTVKDEFKKKVEAQGLRKVFKISEPTLSCKGIHLSIAVVFEPIKSDPKNKKDTKNKK